MNDQKSIRFRHDEAGFLLLDAIAIAIFLSMTAAALGLYQHSARIRRETELKTSAIYIAQTQISNLKSRIASGENLAGDFEYLGESEDLNRHGIIFRVESRVESAANLPDQIEESLLRIEVKVEYENQNVEFETLAKK